MTKRSKALTFFVASQKRVVISETERTTWRCSLSGLKQHGEEGFKSFPPYFIIEFYALSEQKYKEASIMWIKTIDEDYEYNAMYLNMDSGMFFVLALDNSVLYLSFGCKGEKTEVQTMLAEAEVLGDG